MGLLAEFEKDEAEVAEILVILAVHDSFVPLYFIVIAGAAGIMLLSLVTAIPGCQFLATLETSDRLAAALALMVLAELTFYASR